MKKQPEQHWELQSGVGVSAEGSFVLAGEYCEALLKPLGWILVTTPGTSSSEGK